MNLLCRASRNAGVDAWRKETQGGKITHDALAPLERENPAHLQVFEPELDAAEIMSCLSRDERQLLLARALFQMSWEEISRIMGTTEQAARTKFCRLKKKLTDKLSAGWKNSGRFPEAERREGSTSTKTSEFRKVSSEEASPVKFRGSLGRRSTG